MGPSRKRWGKRKIGTKWDQVETGGENWEKWDWDQVETGGENWENLGLSGTKWKQVGKTGKNWD